MPSRNELVIRGNAVGLTASNFPNDSKFEQKILYLEKNGTTYTETLGTGVFTTAGADVANGDTATIGNTVYSFVTALTGVKASSILTVSGVFSDGETVTIGSKAYTFKTTLSSPAQQNQVLIGASASVSLDNLKIAINATGGTEGTEYSVGTVANAHVTATTKDSTHLTVVARDYGTDANLVATSETGANASWTGTFLAGGVANVLNQIKIQASAAATLDVFKDAINNGAIVGVEGTDYSSGQRAHNQVTATTNTNTAQTVAARNSAYDNASIAISCAGGGNMAAGAANLASGVRGVAAVNTTTAAGGPGVSGDKNLV